VRAEKQISQLKNKAVSKLRMLVVVPDELHLWLTMVAAGLKILYNYPRQILPNCPTQIFSSFIPTQKKLAFPGYLTGICPVFVRDYW